MTSASLSRLLPVAGAASLVSAVSTLILIFAPEFYASVPEGLAGRMQRVEDPVYQLRAWTYLVHPFLVFTAAAGVAAVGWRRSRTLALAGLLGFGLWAATEAAQQCLTLFAFDDWRRAWLAGDAAVIASMSLRAAVYDGLWDAAYSFLLIGFIAGNLTLGVLLIRFEDRLAQMVGGFLLAAAALSLFLFSAEAGGPQLPPDVARWAYPAIQPLGRALVGIWLLREARQLFRESDASVTLALNPRG